MMQRQGETNRLLGIARVLWDNRKNVLIGTCAGLLLGVVYLIIAPRIYTTSVILFPKEMKIGGGGNPFAAGMGLSLSPFQNTALSRMKILLLSEAVSERVLEEESLAPVLFPGEWNEEAGRWKSNPPHIREMTRALKKLVTIKEDMRSNYLEVVVSSSNPEVSVRILNAYLEVLNKKMRDDAEAEMVENREFLNQRLAETTDPILKEKIRQLSASQIEEFMRISASAFQVPEPPVKPLDPESPKKVVAIIFSVLAGFFVSSTAVLVYGKLKTIGWVPRIRSLN